MWHQKKSLEGTPCNQCDAKSVGFRTDTLYVATKGSTRRLMIKDPHYSHRSLPLSSYIFHVASRLEAIADRLEAIALRLEAIASRLEAIAIRLEAIAISLEAIAIRLEAIAIRLEAIAIRLKAIGIIYLHSNQNCHIYPFLFTCSPG